MKNLIIIFSLCFCTYTFAQTGGVGAAASELATKIRRHQLAEQWLCIADCKLPPNTNPGCVGAGQTAFDAAMDLKKMMKSKAKACKDCTLAKAKCSHPTEDTVNYSTALTPATQGKGGEARMPQ